MVIETQHLAKVLHIYIFLHDSTILNWALDNGRCPSGGPLFRSKGCSCGKKLKWWIQQERNQPLGPEKDEHLPSSPVLKWEWERKCAILLQRFLPPSLSSHSYHTVGSFLSLRGASSHLSRGLCLLFLHRLQDTTMMRNNTTTVMPPPIANASRRRSENEAGDKKVTPTFQERVSVMISHHWNDILFGVRGQTCSDHAEPNLSARAVNIRRILDLADKGAVIAELDLLYDDGSVAAHHVTSPDDALPENAVRRWVWSLLVVEDLKK